MRNRRSEHPAYPYCRACVDGHWVWFGQDPIRSITLFVFGGVAHVFDADSLAALSDASRWLFPSDGLWRGVVFGLEPPAVVIAAQGIEIAEGNPFYAVAPPPLGFVICSIAWIAGTLALAVWSLERREV